MKYDVEQILSDLETIFKTYFNNKIIALNTEKSDSITLEQINLNAYFMDMDDAAINYDPFILFEISDLNSDGIGPGTSKNITVNFALVLNDNGQDQFIVKRMLRYQRCMEEIIEDNFQSLKCDILKIESLPVLSFQRANESLRYKIVGININSSIS